MMVPSHLKLFFWDVDLATFDPQAYPAFTIARILEHGESGAVAWLRATFPGDQIREVLRSERRLTRKSATFWALVYQVPREEVAALKEPEEPPTGFERESIPLGSERDLAP